MSTWKLGKSESSFLFVRMRQARKAVLLDLSGRCGWEGAGLLEFCVDISPSRRGMRCAGQPTIAEPRVVIKIARRYALITSLSPVALRSISTRGRADKPELKESTFLSSRSAHSNAATSSDPASRSTTPTPGNPHPDAPPPPPVARSGMLKIRVTAAKGLALPQGGESILWI
jgi:hypothetical protein